MTKLELKPELSHLDNDGHIRMVNVSDKDRNLHLLVETPLGCVGKIL